MPYQSLGTAPSTNRRRNGVLAICAAATIALVAGAFYLGRSDEGLGMKFMTPAVKTPTMSVMSPSMSVMKPVNMMDTATSVNMRHKKGFKKLGRPADQRKALIRGLVTEVLRHGRITTTTTRAKAIRRYVDKMIGLAKRGDLHARRQAFGFIYDKQLVKNLFIEAPKRYADRPGGYTRVKKELLPRRGDNAELSYIELV
uniref:Large ribosomal subunit protein bL17c n=1 Tax=Lotharella oceanica TaxID=641309 RepID=A0A7S2XIC1_9EUKA